MAQSGGTAEQRSVQTIEILRASALTVSNGANLGDAMSFADYLQPEDVYRLSPLARVEPLRLLVRATPPFEVARDSRIGTPGAALHLDCQLTFMRPDGETLEALIWVETDAAGDAFEVFVQPLAPIPPRTDCILVAINRDGALARFAQTACASFTRGTRITMATGAQVPVEALKVGDRILTRDDGAQPIRWIGQHTTRASGLFAPIVIAAGILNNAADLIVSPDHRLFIYQRRDTLGTGQSEVMVRARQLLNGETIRQISGGHVDYFQMLLDHHQIIYAEGIAAESTLLDTASSALLPSDHILDLKGLLPAHRRSDFNAIEVQQRLLDRPDAAELLRKSSLG